MKRYFCTYFDHNYLPYGMTLFSSLCNSCIEFELFVLCLSKECYERLIGVDSRLIPISLDELESWDTELKATQFSRSRTEYIFTISPCLPLFIFNKFPNIDVLTYLDSDLYFFESPEILYRELGNKSLYIIEHRFMEEFKFRAEQNGRFNMAFQIYRNNENGHKCLQKWRTECLEWCYDRVEDGKYADQKYLDSWPDDFSNDVVISQNKGANLAPWNFDNFEIILENNKFYIDENPLVFVHYQGFKILSKYLFVWYAWRSNYKNKKIFNLLAFHYSGAVENTKKRYPQVFRGIEHFYPNRGAFFSPKLATLLKWIPSKKLKNFLSLIFIIIFYRKNVFLNFRGFGNLFKA